MKIPLPLLRLSLLSAALFTLPAAADIRIALVIGNSAYAGGAALANPANDAKAMSETLRGMGFVVVELRDGSKAQMNAAVAKVQAALKGKQGVGMLYYAGHGLQVRRTWASAYTVTFGSTLKFPPRTQAGEAHIVAREQLNLPAGVFNTFRMEVTARAFDDKGEQPATQSTVWMAPDLPLPVRSESTLDTPGVGKMKIVEEMIRIVRAS